MLFILRSHSYSLFVFNSLLILTRKTCFAKRLNSFNSSKVDISMYLFLIYIYTHIIVKLFVRPRYSKKGNRYSTLFESHFINVLIGTPNYQFVIPVVCSPTDVVYMCLLKIWIYWLYHRDFSNLINFGTFGVLEILTFTVLSRDRYQHPRNPENYWKVVPVELELFIPEGNDLSSLSKTTKLIGVTKNNI